MIAASLVGIFLIPALYVAFQRMRERVKGQVLAADRKVVPAEEASAPH